MTKQILPNKWFIWAIVAIVVAGVGLWGYIQYTLIQDSVAENISVVPAAKTAKTVDTFDWQTYRNEKYGFEFKYPSDWKIGENDGEKYAPVDGTKVVEVFKIVCCKFPDEGMYLKIVYSSDSSKYPVIQNLLAEKSDIYSAENFTVDKYAIANFEGVCVKTKTGSDFTYEEDVQLYLKNGTGFYTLLWRSIDTNKEGFTASAYLEKILSTFKFIK